jgi:hypothetical protein
MHASAPLRVDKTGPDAQNVSVTPNLLYASAAVRVDATLSDPLHSVVPFPGVNSNIRKGEGFIDLDPNADPNLNGTGFPLTPRDGLFNSPVEAVYTTIPLATVKSLTAGTHSIWVHGRDSSGNWGTAVAATLTILPNSIFADGFETGFAPWSSVAGSPSISGAAARPPSSQGMQVILAGTTVVGYVTDVTPMAEPGYHARFYFNPNSTTTGNATPDIFVGLDSGGAVLFRVQYNRTNQGVYRVRAVVTRAGGTTATGWFSINNAWNAIEIAWQSGNPASFKLYTNGTLRRTLTGLNTSAYRLDSVWLGPSGSLGNNVNGTMYFDDFVSTRNTYIGL